MREKTRQEYLRLAAHFYTERLGDVSIPTGQQIADALCAIAQNHGRPYWRRLRRALEVDQLERGNIDAADLIASTQNPATRDGLPVKPKQRRVKSVPPSDFDKLVDALQTSELNSTTVTTDPGVLAAITMAHLLGCRPNEMPKVQALDNNRVFIPGSKKTDDRGLDRTIILPEKEHNLICWAVEWLAAEPETKAGKIACIQSRLRTLTKRLWPRRNALPTLYSFRHQMGSDLKASGRDRREIAYIMGHQCTKSVDAYGDRRRSAYSRSISADASAEELDELIRENHQPAYSQQQQSQDAEQAFDLDEIIDLDKPLTPSW